MGRMAGVWTDGDCVKAIGGTGRGCWGMQMEAGTKNCQHKFKLGVNMIGMVVTGVGIARGRWGRLGGDWDTCEGLGTSGGNGETWEDSE